MPLSVSNVKPLNNSKVFSAFQNTAHEKSVYTTLRYKRNHRVEEHEKKHKILTATASTVATLLPMIYFAKKQNGLKKITNLFRIDYGLKEILAVSSAGILGGVTAGIALDKDKNKKHKINEAVFQFLNATVPTALVGGTMELIKDNTKYKNSKGVKIVSIMTGLLAGMPLAAFLANIINDPHDKEPDRKLTLKDSIVNMDDALGALMVARLPFVDKLHLEKVIPAIFAWCGYRAGESN